MKYLILGMLEIKATPKKFDDFWNNEINPSFDEIREIIDELDLSNKTLNYIASILEKDIKIVYGKLDKVFTDHWKYFARSEENLEKVD